MKTFFLFLATSLLLLGCTTGLQSTPVAVATAITTPIQAVGAPAFFGRGLNAYRSNGWDQSLARAIAELGTSLTATVPSDIASYCPGYSGLTAAQRTTVWQNLLIALTKYESDYDPAVSFNETAVDPGLVENDGSPVISRGLLQISIGSANGYACQIGNAQELHNPETNLRCAVRIASQWVKRDGVIADGSGGAWRGMARYWSPFRRDDRKGDIMQSVRTTPGC